MISPRCFGRKMCIELFSAAIARATSLVPHPGPVPSESFFLHHCKFHFPFRPDRIFLRNFLFCASVSHARDSQDVFLMPLRQRGSTVEVPCPRMGDCRSTQLGPHFVLYRNLFVRVMQSRGSVEKRLLNVDKNRLNVRNRRNQPYGHSHVAQRGPVFCTQISYLHENAYAHIA